MRRILGHKHLILLNCGLGLSIREDLHEDCIRAMTAEERAKISSKLKNEAVNIVER